MKQPNPSYWLFAVQFIAAMYTHTLFAQTFKPIGSSDQLSCRNFTVQLLATADEQYGCDNLADIKLIKHQPENSILNRLLDSKADAFAAAKWMIDQYIASKFLPRFIPPQVLSQPKSTQS